MNNSEFMRQMVQNVTYKKRLTMETSGMFEWIYIPLKIWHDLHFERPLFSRTKSIRSLPVDNLSKKSERSV